MVFVYEGKKTLERRELFECLYEQEPEERKIRPAVPQVQALNSLSHALEKLLCKNFIPIMFPFCQALKPNLLLRKRLTDGYILIR